MIITVTCPTFVLGIHFLRLSYHKPCIKWLPQLGSFPVVVKCINQASISEEQMDQLFPK